MRPFVYERAADPASAIKAASQSTKGRPIPTFIFLREERPSLTL